MSATELNHDGPAEEVALPAAAATVRPPTPMAVRTGLGLALIACLGLLGMASFTAEKRTKEIGIRRVMGASTSGVVGLLSRELIVLVLTANLIAWPAAFFWTRGWLQGFPYRITITLFPFAASAFLVLLVSFLTIAFQAVKAAAADPVESLRYE